MKTISAAVIGVGMMGKNHARVYSELEGVELAAVSDLDEMTAKKVAGRYKCRYCVDYRRMLEEEDIDLVSVAVPTQAHRQVALDCIDRGINVLVEKPISDTIESAENIIAAAKRRKVKLTVGHIERFNPAVIELKKRLDRNELGHIFKVSANRVGPFPKRIRDVGVVIDLATHDLDVMRYLIGSEVKRVYAETERRVHTSHEDILAGVLRFENNTIGTLAVDWLTPEKIRELIVVGEKGMFVLRYLTQELFFHEKIDPKLNEYGFADVMMGAAKGNVTDIHIEKSEPLKAKLKSFVRCVREDATPQVSGEDALEALKLAHCLIESSRKNTVIKL